ncbi:MAG: MgtC/SapB family protein [Burkholderiales bacterium]|nr:MgtC/SapB family protein [Burkholderiales bacterium]
MDLIVARNFLIALLIGALIGIEREKKKVADPSQAFGGIRTYTLLALLGAASAWLARELGTPWVFAAVLAVVGAAVVASYVLQGRASNETPGLTSEVAALVVCLLGAMVVVGNPTLAVALAVITSALLAYKQPLHGMVQRIGIEDLYAGIKLLIASCIVLPLLPDHTLDRWGAINPYTLWLLVILISGLSLLGYVAVRMLGHSNGTAITGIAGGLVSSTATTLSFARTSAADAAADAAHPAPPHASHHALCAGILLSWLVMLLRVGVLVAMLNPALLPSLAVTLGAMTLANAGFALWHYRASRHDSPRAGPAAVAVRNPFSLSAAIRFGALFALVMLCVKIAQAHAPGFGVYLVSALAGLVDVDAITLSMAASAQGGELLVQASRAITVAVLANTLVKGAMVLVLGRGPLRGQLTRAAGGILAVALLALLAQAAA